VSSNASPSALTVKSICAEPLIQQYDRFIGLREEAWIRYGFETYGIHGPRAKLIWPEISPRFGEIRIRRLPSVFRIAGQAVSGTGSGTIVLEYGPGRGVLCAALLQRFQHCISRYYGIEIDSTVTGPYIRISTPLEIMSPIDVIIASEVIEHISLDSFLSELVNLRGLRSDSSTLIVSVPNPLAPGGIARDATHVQAYPWYDLYALLRLEYSTVEVVRTYYVWNAGRLFRLPARIVLCGLQELDWAEGIICVAKHPIHP
jgi:hypothetical protein